MAAISWKHPQLEPDQPMDPNNPVVALCAQGMQAEAKGRTDEARQCFMQAWDARKDDYDACVAAHFVARHQDSAEETLTWNRKALDFANAVGDDRVKGFYASLYLNLGHSHEVLGDNAEAKKYFALAAERLQDLPEGRYGDVVRRGVDAARERVPTD